MGEEEILGLSGSDRVLFGGSAAAEGMAAMIVPEVMLMVMQLEVLMVLVYWHWPRDEAQFGEIREVPDGESLFE
jgi:hypothetical protein